MPLGTQRCMWPVLMDKMQWSASWSTTVLMSVSRITRASHLCTLLLRPLMVPCVWSFWLTAELTSTSRYVHLGPNMVGESKSCVLFASKHFLMFPQSRDGKSPLHLTAVHGRFTRSQTLIQNGKAVCSQLASNWFACTLRVQVCVSDTGGEIDCVDKDGNTPLHVAARYGHELLINTLITSGADCTRFDSVFGFLLKILVNHHCLLSLICSFFLCRRGVHGMFPLHLAALNAHADCCRKLLSSGIN